MFQSVQRLFRYLCSGTDPRIAESFAYASNKVTRYVEYQRESVTQCALMYSINESP